MNQTSFKCGAYTITSYGNGTAYNITKTHQSIWIQGDEAWQLREATDNFDKPSVLDDLFLEYFAS